MWRVVFRASASSLFFGVKLQSDLHERSSLSLLCLISLLEKVCVGSVPRQKLPPSDRCISLIGVYDRGRSSYHQHLQMLECLR